VVRGLVTAAQGEELSVNEQLMCSAATHVTLPPHTAHSDTVLYTYSASLCSKGGKRWGKVHPMCPQNSMHGCDAYVLATLQGSAF
jgi:hypothetical protein